jgi:hypothetical protein
MIKRFRFLPYAITFGLVLYVVLCSIVLCIYQWMRKQTNTDRESSIWTALLRGKSFECLYSINDTFLVHSSSELSVEKVAEYNQRRQCIAHIVLLVWRVACCLYFLVIPTLWGLAVLGSGSGAKYFTDWNFLLITLHYALMSAATAIGWYYRQEFFDFQQEQRLSNNTNNNNAQLKPFWSPGMQYAGYLLQISYTFTGATALFITVVAYGTLGHDFYLWNVSAHFVTSISFIFDAIVNRLLIRGEHLVFNLTWIILYMIFIWGMVGNKSVTNWPYFFLETTTATVFVWYVVLFILNIIFFFVWKGINYVFKVSISRWVHDVEVVQQHPIVTHNYSQNQVVLAHETSGEVELHPIGV